jgi:hypothetical protein
LILKSVITPEDWEDMKEHIQYDYLKDNHFTELKNLEMKTEQLNVLAAMDPYVGKFFSIDYIRQEILGMTEKQIEEMDMQMADDIEMGRAMNPTDLVAADQQQLDAETDNIELDQEVKKAQIASQKSKTESDRQKAQQQPAAAKPKADK